MSNKITKEELEKVVGQQKKINEILTNIGVLETQKHSLLHNISTINKDMEEKKKDLEGKYGSININLEDGTYTTISKEEE